VLLENRDMLARVEAPAVDDEDAAEAPDDARHDEAIHRDARLLGRHPVEIQVSLVGKVTLTELSEEAGVDTDNGSLHVLVGVLDVEAALAAHQVHELGEGLQLFFCQRPP
jgi:hypothetical protein